MWEGFYQLLLMAEGFALRSFDDEEDAEDTG
jgi:hypothetical protein